MPIFYIDNIKYGTTPATITLPKYIWNGSGLILKKKGFDDTPYMIQSSFQLVGILNIFFWPGFIIDAATGNTLKINHYNVNPNINLNTKISIRDKVS